MRGVSIVGVGMVPFGRYPSTPVAQLARDAVIDAFADCGVSRSDVQEAFVGSAFGGIGIGQRIAKLTGMSGMPITNVENACASGSTALRGGWLTIASGHADIVIAIGADKLSATAGPLAANHEDHEAEQGLNMPGLYAMRAQTYMREYGATPEDLAAVVVKNRRHAMMNPHAYLRSEVDVESVLGSPSVADPLTLFQCCPKVDGAAAAILVADEFAEEFSEQPVRILGSQLCSGSFTAGFRDFAVPEVSVRAAQQAYAMAGVGPADIDVAEIHDAFSISELLYYEALQLCGRGGAVDHLKSGAADLGGAQPVNVSGGLIGKGHPPGATGLAQVHEIVTQLRGRAGERQVAGARVGMAHCTGGGVSGYDHAAASIHVLAR